MWECLVFYCQSMDKPFLQRIREKYANRPIYLLNVWRYNRNNGNNMGA